MRQVYLSFVTLLFGLTSFAQRTIKLEVTLTSPADGSTIVAGTTFDQKFVIKNLGPAAIKATDSIGYIDPGTPSGSLRLILGAVMPVGDTIQINQSGLAFDSTTAPGTYDYCIQAIALNRTDTIKIDSFAEDCNAVIVTAPKTGIAEIIKEKISEELLSINPNPASAVIAFDFISKGNSEIVARVYDIAGRTVLTSNYGKSFAGQQGFTLDVSALNNGMYFVELRQDGYKAVGKLSKQ